VNSNGIQIHPTSSKNFGNTNIPKSPKSPRGLNANNIQLHPTSSKSLVKLKSFGCLNSRHVQEHRTKFKNFGSTTTPNAWEIQQSSNPRLHGGLNPNKTQPHPVTSKNPRNTNMPKPNIPLGGWTQHPTSPKNLNNTKSPNPNLALVVWSQATFNYMPQMPRNSETHTPPLILETPCDVWTEAIAQYIPQVPRTPETKTQGV